MRFIRIDPFDSRIDEHLTPCPLDRDFLTKQIGCDWITRVVLSEGIDLWIDDNSLLNETGEQRFFRFKGSKQMLAGNGVMCGVSRFGDTVSLPRSIGIDEVADRIVFIGNQDDAEAAIERGEIDRPATYYIDGETRQKIWEWRPTHEAVA